MPAKPAVKPSATPAKSRPSGLTRTEANRAQRIARHMRNHPNWKNQHGGANHPVRPGFPKQSVVLSILVPEHKGQWYAAILNGVILSCGSFNDAAAAAKASHDPRTVLVRRNGATLNRVEA